MTPEEIIAMAREVGLLPDNSHPTPETRAMRKRCEVVKRFANLVAEKAAAKEREACAQVAKVISDKYGFGYYGDEVDAADEIEAAIRARGQKEGV